MCRSQNILGLHRDKGHIAALSDAFCVIFRAEKKMLWSCPAYVLVKHIAEVSGQWIFLFATLLMHANRRSWLFMIWYYNTEFLKPRLLFLLHWSLDFCFLCRFLADRTRLNVALTRAKYSLIILLHVNSLKVLLTLLVCSSFMLSPSLSTVLY